MSSSVLEYDTRIGEKININSHNREKWDNRV